MKPPLRLRFAPGAGDHEVAVAVGAGGRERIVTFRASVPLRRSADALLCLGIAPALEIGRDLVVEGPVDASLLAHAERIQSLLCSWYPGLKPVSVRAAAGAARYPKSRGAGLFFSGGVDSAYSLLSARERLTGLVTLIGTDGSSRDAEAAERLRGLSREVAAGFRLSSVIVETDARRVFDRMIGWVEFHGSLLAAVAHLLADRFDAMLIASSADESSWKRPWGSHPGLDPLFGTPGLKIEHHGLVHRLAKIEAVADDPRLMDRLRVCDETAENCGRCNKCRFVLRALDLSGRRDRAVTFPDAERAATSLYVSGEGSRSDLENLRRAATAAGDDGLRAEIDRALRRYDLKKALRRIAPIPGLERRFRRWKRRRRFSRAFA